MSLTPSTAKEQLQFYSRYPIDKIVGVWEGDFDKATDVVTRTGSLGDIYVYPIAHGLTRPVFVDLIWSDDGITWADGGVAGTGGGVSLAFSDSTNIYIIGGLFVPGAGTRYYKVIAFWIDTYDSTNPSVESYLSPTKTINFDSRLNYQKVYQQGQLSFTAGTLGATETLPVAHDFGYRPNARGFFEAFPGEVWPLNIGGAANPFLYDAAQDECELKIYDTRIDVVMYRFSNTQKRAWYRIYLDS